MRVALVFSRFHLQGGTERQVVMLARDLAARGHELHVFTRLVRAEPPPGVRLHVMPRLPLGPLFELLLFSRWARAAIAAFERRSGPFDVRHSFGRTLGQDVYRFGGGCHLTYLEHAHALERPPWLRRLLAHTPLQRVKANLERASLQGQPPPVVIANSNMVADDLAERFDLPPERLVVIPNGVDLELFRPPLPGERDEIRRAWGLEPEHEVALFVGSGFARKGLEPSLRALALLKDRRPLLRLVVLGRDQRLPWWSAMAQRLGVASRVVWAGTSLRPERAYRGADLQLLPTAYDACANSTLEALASGVPVITSAMNGAGELLSSGRHGEVLATPVHPADLAAALERWLARTDRATVASHARALAEAHPVEHACDRVLEIYRRLAPSRGVPS